MFLQLFGLFYDILLMLLIIRSAKLVLVPKIRKYSVHFVIIQTKKISNLFYYTVFQWNSLFVFFFCYYH